MLRVEMSILPVTARLCAMSELVWWPHKGYGYQEGSFDYGDAYWDEFRLKDETNLGRILQLLRDNFVRKHIDAIVGSLSDMVDVGIGGGAYLSLISCKGTDVNPKAIEWLENRDCLWKGEDTAGMTFWDSFEHIPDPSRLLAKCEGFAAISTPIYESAEHVLHSKHYKPGEHLWYFTDRGLKRYMADLGFMLIDQNRMEESVGRDGIGTYAFVRGT